MNKEQFFEYHKQFCSDILEMTRKKNEDYTGVTDDPFANFTTVEKSGIATTEQGFLTRMSDKMQRINSYAQRGELSVEDEKVEDTLQDLANYCILFSAYIRSKHERSKPVYRVPAKSSRSHRLYFESGEIVPIPKGDTPEVSRWNFGAKDPVLSKWDKYGVPSDWG